MLLTILILSVALIIAVAVLFLHRWNLAKMNLQLQNILEQFGTNETLRSNLSGKELNHFVANVNRLIELFKKEEQESIRMNKELKQEITNISHDIRTPLTSIKGFAELLQNSQLRQHEWDEYLAIIQKKVDILMQIADRFYEISVLDSEEESIVLEQFPLGDILVEHLLVFQKDFESRKITVQVDENQLYAKIWSDKKGTERIILNLVQNALRYTETFLHLSVLEEDAFWVLQLQNDTQPIAEKELAKLFERSYTIDASRSQGQTGLGLYIVKKLAEHQGGWVKAEYESGVFFISVGFQKDRNS